MIRCHLEIQTTSGIDRRKVTPDGRVGIAAGACPGCKAEPFRVQGGNRRIHDRETYVADGRCVDCGDAVGYIYARVETVFGLEEDRNVLEGRERVY